MKKKELKKEIKRLKKLVNELSHENYIVISYLYSEALKEYVSQVETKGKPEEEVPMSQRKDQNVAEEAENEIPNIDVSTFQEKEQQIENEVADEFMEKIFHHSVLLENRILDGYDIVGAIYIGDAQLLYTYQKKSVNNQ